MIIDSHCHLLASRYDMPVNEVIENCFSENISLLLNIATKESEFNEILDISRKYKRIYNSVGIHPHETENLDTGIFDRINKVILENNKTIAVGETGLDFYYNHSNKKSQIYSFEKHIEKALEHNLPIIVHSREAEKDTKEILYSYKNKSDITGVIHCFTGSEKFAREMIDIDFYISFSGIITFKNSSNLREIVSIVDKNRILVETDSPFLAPVPNRGKTNMPSFIIHTIRQISAILNISEAEVEKITSNNFFNLFKNVKALSIS
ncbi:TatD family hydrolase [Pelagibacteraceae bacterium]|nr:TatD family hydrolase [Pelagibacteraceae bacterium]